MRVAFETLDPRILPQMGVKVAFQSEPSAGPAVARDVLTVPKEAVQRDNNRDIAWVVKDGRAERRAITVGNGNTITAGLTAGETVILNPPEKLTDGVAVTLETTR